MKSTIDKAGRLVIPQQIRREAGLRSGMVLDIRWRDGRIEIEPAWLPVTLVCEGPFLVAVPGAGMPPLTAGIVEQTRAAIYEERAAGINDVADVSDRH